MTGPICHARNLFSYTKNIITYLFILQMRKYFMQRIEQKWIENWTSLFCGKLDFWRSRSDTAAPCGHGFHNHHITCQLWPLQVTYDRATYGNTPYDQSLQPFLVEVGRIWKHRSISSIIISRIKKALPCQNWWEIMESQTELYQKPQERNKSKRRLDRSYQWGQFLNNSV